MSFLCHSNVIPCHSSRPPGPCHKVWRKIVHRKVRLGDVTGMTPDWHFRHSMVILNLNDHQMEEWRRDDRDEIPPSQAHFLRNDLGVTRFCHSEVSPSFADANEWDDFDHFPVSFPAKAHSFLRKKNTQLGRVAKKGPFLVGLVY